MFLIKAVRRSIHNVNANRNFSTLVLAEHLSGKLNSNVGSCLTAAAQLNDPTVDVLVHGSADSINSQVEELKKYPGIGTIHTA